MAMEYLKSAKEKSLKSMEVDKDLIYIINSQAWETHYNEAKNLLQKFNYELTNFKQIELERGKYHFIALW